MLKAIEVNEDERKMLKREFEELEVLEVLDDKEPPAKVVRATLDMKTQRALDWLKKSLTFVPDRNMYNMPAMRQRIVESKKDKAECCTEECREDGMLDGLWFAVTSYTNARLVFPLDCGEWKFQGDFADYISCLRLFAFEITQKNAVEVGRFLRHMKKRHDKNYHKVIITDQIIESCDYEFIPNFCPSGSAGFDDCQSEKKYMFLI